MEHNSNENFLSLENDIIARCNSQLFVGDVEFNGKKYTLDTWNTYHILNSIISMIHNQKNVVTLL